MDPCEYNKRGRLPRATVVGAALAAALSKLPDAADVASWGAGTSPAPTDETKPRSLTDGLQKRLQLLRPRGVSKLPQRLRLDLPDALARHVERPADLFERVLRAIADAK